MYIYMVVERQHLSLVHAFVGKSKRLDQVCRSAGAEIISFTTSKS